MVQDHTHSVAHSILACGSMKTNLCHNICTLWCLVYSIQEGRGEAGRGGTGGVAYQW